MNPKASARLDRLIKKRQALISSGTLEKELVKFHKEFPEDCDNSRYDFLDAVSLYDRSVKAGEKRPERYSDLLMVFEIIERSTPDLAFYIPNYMLLCARNAGPPYDNEVPTYFQQAVKAASNLPDDERGEALGYLYYNVARWLHKKGRLADALGHWQSAAAHRLMFYEHMKTANESRERLLAAAQQVAEIRKDFYSFFPDNDIANCGIDAQVYATLKAEFGQELHLFSVNK